MIVEHRVIFGDTDQMGVVYYANYFRFFEAARAEYWRRCGGSNKDFDDWGIALPVVDARCRYRRPARYEDLLAIRISAEPSGAARVQFDYSVSRVNEDQVLAEGYTVHAAINREGKPTRIPDQLIARLIRE